MQHAAAQRKSTNRFRQGTLLELTVLDEKFIEGAQDPKGSEKCCPFSHFRSSLTPSFCILTISPTVPVVVVGGLLVFSLSNSQCWSVSVTLLVLELWEPRKDLDVLLCALMVFLKYSLKPWVVNCRRLLTPLLMSVVIVCACIQFMSS